MTGLRADLSRLALGTAQFGLEYGVANRGGQMAAAEAACIVRTAKARGLDTLDTAALYGDSERRLGEIGVGDWRVVTKLPPYPDASASVGEWVEAATRASLHRLGLTRLYGLLLHRPGQLLERDGAALYAALGRLTHLGLVEKIGVSIYDPSELDALCGAYRFDLVQAPFNVIDRRLIETGWAARLRAEGIEVHVRSIFLQGLLLMNADSRPRPFARWQPLWDQWERWLAERNLHPLEVCVQHALSFPHISRVLVGVDNAAQLVQVLDAAATGRADWPRDLRTDDVINPALWPGIQLT